jgi:hypothetical protein
MDPTQRLADFFYYYYTHLSVVIIGIIPYAKRVVIDHRSSVFRTHKSIYYVDRQVINITGYLCGIKKHPWILRICVPGQLSADPRSSRARLDYLILALPYLTHTSLFAAFISRCDEEFCL